MNDIVALKTNQLISQKLNLELDMKVREYMEHALAPSTMIAYSNDFKVFTYWCESVGLQAIPATSGTIARFLAQQASNGIKPATLTRRLAAIRLTHEGQGYQTPTQDKAVRAVLQGIRRDIGITQDKKAPLTVERMASLVSYCTGTITGLRDKALLLIGFAGAFRRSELVALTVNDLEYTPEGIKVTIRKSKTDQEAKGQVIAIPNGLNFRIVDALKTWLNAADIHEGALFRQIKKGGHIQTGALTDRSVANIVKHYASLAGLTVKDFSGHSLRAGFITSAAVSGADLFKLMEVSRHKKPETIMGYVRESKLFENHAGKSFL